MIYENFAPFSNQGEVDCLVAELVALYQVPRLMFGVVATSKGLVVGNLEQRGNLGRLLTHSWWCHNPSRCIRYKRFTDARKFPPNRGKRRSVPEAPRGECFRC